MAGLLQRFRTCGAWELESCEPSFLSVFICVHSPRRRRRGGSVVALNRSGAGTGRKTAKRGEEELPKKNQASLEGWPDREKQQLYKPERQKSYAMRLLRNIRSVLIPKGRSNMAPATIVVGSGTAVNEMLSKAKSFPLAAN